MKEGPAGSVNDIISQDLKNNDVFLYMKVGHARVNCAAVPDSCSIIWVAAVNWFVLQGVPEAPQCGFSNAACRILDAYSAHHPSRATQQNLLLGVAHRFSSMHDGSSEFSAAVTITLDSVQE